MRKSLSRQPRRKIRWGRVYLLLLIFVVILGSAVHAAYQTIHRFLDSPVTATASSNPTAPVVDSSRINILLL
ncbi:MAG: hypothetical protein E6713_14100, partial [Sporomusaceae bacterium]|nr:hypothetical protein [Sporomusaceae bacterium]